MSWRIRVANFAVNTSNTAGTVFFGKDSVTVGPHGKLEISAAPSFWTKNIQLVKGTSHIRNREPKKQVKGSAPVSESFTGPAGEVTNG
jgi:hypothetical protein